MLSKSFRGTWTDQKITPATSQRGLYYWALFHQARVSCRISWTFSVLVILKQRGTGKRMRLSEAHEHSSQALSQLVVIYAVASPMPDMSQDLWQQRLLTTDSPIPQYLRFLTILYGQLHQWGLGKTCRTSDSLSLKVFLLDVRSLCYSFFFFFFSFLLV